MFVAREASKFIRQYCDQQFFLVASFMKPHTPLFAPAEWAARYPVDDMELPQVGDIAGYPEHIRKRIEHTQRIAPHLRRATHAGYFACLAFADHCIGCLYDALDREGLLEDTIVVYTSDHGDMTGQHGLYGKFCLFDPSVKVPMIVSYPKILPQDKVSSALIEQIGLYPTLAALTGTGPIGATTNYPIQDAPATVDGSSFLDPLVDPAQGGPDAVFSEYHLRNKINEYMIRTRRFKYIHNHGSTDELYDLETDPGEYVNRIDDATLQSVHDNLRARLFAWYEPATNPYRESAAR
jgi:arylsulfatase A-like enzyme